ncbi:hypothetical protein ACGC1H_000881 [Rhizoctonia solani]
MLACLRISRAPLTHAYLALRALSTSAPLSNATPDEPTEAIRTLADLVQSAAEEQDAAALPTSLLEKPKPIYPNQVRHSPTSLFHKLTTRSL